MKTISKNILLKNEPLLLATILLFALELIQATPSMLQLRHRANVHTKHEAELFRSSESIAQPRAVHAVVQARDDEWLDDVWLGDGWFDEWDDGFDFVCYEELQ